jgi:hypothetical protein
VLAAIVACRKTSMIWALLKHVSDWCGEEGIVNKKIDRLAIGLLCLEILTPVHSVWADTTDPPQPESTDLTETLSSEIKKSSPTTNSESATQSAAQIAQHSIAPPETIASQPISEPGLERLPCSAECKPETIALQSPEPLQEETETDPLAQVTSVSELTDVQPGDWAYEALRSLVERYGVISGYSDGTFRGNRSLSRYEFAATVDAVLAQVEQLATASKNRRSLQEDIFTLQRLQTFYRSALSDIGERRLPNIENRIKFQEDHRFSTTTKLQGQTVWAFTGGSDASDTVVTRTRLNFLTSFNAQDQLVTQLELGNNGLDAVGFAQNQGDNLLGTTGLLADGGGLDYVSVGSQVRLSRLYYSFRPIPELSVAVGPKLMPSDFVDRNSFANNSATNFSSSFFANNPFIVQNQIDRPAGAGIALTWKPEELPLTVRALYAAADAGSPDLAGIEGGLFGDRRQGTIEAEYAFRKDLVARLQFTSAEINGVGIDALGLNVEWALNPIIGVFGRFGLASYDGFNVALGQDLDLSPKTWAIGIQARNFLIPGTLAGFAMGQPFVEDDLGDATQTNFEAFISLYLNDNVSVTPSIIFVTNPNNQSTSDIWQGTLRTVFSF